MIILPTFKMANGMVPKNLTTEQKANRRKSEKKYSCGFSAPYSSDLSPCDFFLFPRLKSHLKGRHFRTLDNIQKSVTDELKGISAEAFQHCYEQW
jgi:hypothetical protein